MKKKVLIVEDEPMLLEILVDELKRHGIETISASDGEEGLKKALSEKPDLMLVDIIMPKMDGITMLKELKKAAIGKTIPAIVLSNLSDSDTTADALEIGIHEFLVKSDWKVNDLVVKVKHALKMD
jgi:DNA-binding response OmpR family regulator